MFVQHIAFRCPLYSKSISNKHYGNVRVVPSRIVMVACPSYSQIVAFFVPLAPKQQNKVTKVHGRQKKRQKSQSNSGVTRASIRLGTESVKDSRRVPRPEGGRPLRGPKQHKHKRHSFYIRLTGSLPKKQRQSLDNSKTGPTPANKQTKTSKPPPPHLFW